MMDKTKKITKADAITEAWDDMGDGGVRAWNYKFTEEDKSIVRATLAGHHGWYMSGEKPYYYYIIDGEGVFELEDGQKTHVSAGDSVEVPAGVKYDYYPVEGAKLDVVLFMQNMWEN